MAGKLAEIEALSHIGDAGVVDLVFPDDYDDIKDTYRIFELPEEMREYIRQEKEIFIRGRASERAVVCTDDRTYELILAETSNTLVFASPEGAPGTSPAPKRVLERCAPRAVDAPEKNLGASPDSATTLKAAARAAAARAAASVPIQSASLSSYFVMRETAPDTARLESLLRRRAFKGETADDDLAGVAATSATAVATADEELTLAQESMMCMAGDTLDVNETEVVGGTCAAASRIANRAANNESDPSSPSALPGLSMEDIRSEIHASRVELKKALGELGALEVDFAADAAAPNGKRWVILDDTYVWYVMDLVLSTCVIRGWPLSAVPVAECAAEVGGEVRPAVARHVIRSFASHRDGADAAADEVVDLDESEVCRFRALELLLSRSDDPALDDGPQVTRAWTKEDFFVAWRAACPDEFNPRNEMLVGIALIDEEAGPAGLVHPFLTRHLPSDPRLRFQELFRLRTTWNLPELEAYTRDLIVPGLTYEQILLKYAREITYSLNGPREGTVPKEQRRFCLRVVS